MEKIAENTEKFSWRKRVSLKAALIFTTLTCVIAGLAACVLETWALSSLRESLYNRYIVPFVQETEGTVLLSKDGSAVTLYQKIPQGYLDPDTGEFYAYEDTDPASFVPEGYLRVLYRFSDSVFTWAAMFFTAALAFFLDAVWFYRWKIKKPLGILHAAAEKIGNNDLGFTISQPSADELGKLCLSFESMRSSLEAGQKEMWRTVEERRRLNAAFAHDLRTPLTVLQGYSDYLLEGLSEGKVSLQKTEETVSTMKRSLVRLQRYVEDMRALQKLEDIVPEKQEVSLSGLEKQVTATVEILRGPEGAALSFSGGGVVLLDQEMFFRVFENLMSNAGRYAKEKVEIALEAEQGALTLTVADDGKGFPPEALKRAAEPYYRGEQREEAADGGGFHFGLGLYICRVLCEKHGGSLSFGNRPRGGACVTAVFR